MGSNFVPLGIFGNVWRYFGLSQLVDGEMILVSSRLMLGMLLNILHCTTEPLQQELSRPKQNNPYTEISSQGISSSVINSNPWCPREVLGLGLGQPTSSATGHLGHHCVRVQIPGFGFLPCEGGLLTESGSRPLVYS